MYQLPSARTYVNNLLQIAYINTTSQKDLQTHLLKYV